MPVPCADDVVDVAIKLPDEIKQLLTGALQAAYWVGVRDGAVIAAIVLILLFIVSLVLRRGR